MTTEHPTDSDVIAFTMRRYNHRGAQERDVAELLGMKPILFWLEVVHIIDDPARIAGLPPELQVQCTRLREIRHRQVEQRTARLAS